MSGKEDLRVRRTKKALYDAFIELLNQKPFDAITVNELCDTAKIRRATFYKHYSDKFDFLNAYTKVLRDRFDKIIFKNGKPALTPDYYVAYAKRIIHFINEHSTAVHNICHSYLFPTVLSIIVQQNYKDTCERLRISVSNGVKLPASVEMIAAMCTGGVAGCIYSWIVEDSTASPEEVAEQVGAIVESIVYNGKCPEN